MKLALLVFFTSIFISLPIKQSSNLPGKHGYVLIPEGIYIYDSASEVSKKAIFVPYNSEIRILNQTTRDDKLGILTTSWLKVSYKDQIGFCPEAFIYKHNLIDTSRLTHIEICDFFKETNNLGGFYCEEGSDSTMDHLDSMVIKDISLSNCYYYSRLLLNDKIEMPFPLSLNKKEFTFDSSSCRLEIRYIMSESNKLKTLTLSWNFDGGETVANFKQLGNDVSITILYSAD